MIVEKGYATQKGSQCFLSCLANYLAFRRIDISEVELFLRTEGYKLRQVESGLMAYSVAIYEEPENLGVPFYNYRFDSREDARKCLINFVENEANVVIIMAANKLRYNSAFKYAGDEVPHCVNVIGYDGKDKFFFSDGYIAGFKGDTFEGYVSLEDFVDAWEACGFMLFVIDTDKMHEESYEHIDISLRKIADEEIRNGKIMREYFVNQLKRLKGFWHTEEFEKNVMETNTYIRLSGILTVKSYYQELLEIRYSETGFAEMYEDLRKEWNLISYMLIKLAYSNDISKLEDIGHHISEAFDKEDTILAEMSKLESE